MAAAYGTNAITRQPRSGGVDETVSRIKSHYGDNKAVNEDSQLIRQMQYFYNDRGNRQAESAEPLALAETADKVQIR